MVTGSDLEAGDVVAMEFLVLSAGVDSTSLLKVVPVIIVVLRQFLTKSPTVRDIHIKQQSMTHAALFSSSDQVWVFEEGARNSSSRDLPSSSNTLDATER